jgi:hypothetical protein
MNLNLLFALSLFYYLHISECVLVKHLLHVSTEFVFYLTTVISHHYSVASGQLTEQTMLICVSSNQQLLDQNRTLYVISCSQHSMEGQNTLSIVLPLPCSFIYMSAKHFVTDKFPTCNYVCWSDLHNLSDGKQRMNGGMI